MTHVPTIQQTEKTNVPKEGKLYVRIPEIARMMGMSRSALYTEIGSGRIKVRKAGRNKLIAIADVHDQFPSLPTNQHKY